MAVQEFIPVAAGSATTSTVSTASTAEIVLGNGNLFIVTASQDSYIKFGNSGMAAASASDFYIPAKTPMKFDLGSHCDRIRVFGSAASTIVSVQPISRS